MSTRLEDYENAPELEGRVELDEGWYRLAVGPELYEHFAPQIAQLGFSVTPVAHPHISVIKDERPSAREAKFGRSFVREVVRFRVSPTLKMENGRHVWVDCYSPRLCEIRAFFALPTLMQDGVYRVSFHSTLAKIDEPRPATLRPQYRLTPRTHIDVETLMQHV